MRLLTFFLSFYYSYANRQRKSIFEKNVISV